MRHESAYGVILLSGSVVLLAMGVIHPRAIPFDDNTALARMATMDAWAHSLAILGTWLVLLGLVGLSRLLGLQRVKVMAALLAFALATVGVVVAATLDGFVVPKLAEQWSEADKVVRGNLMQLMRFSVLVASSLTRVYLLLGAASIALWSWVVYRDRYSQALCWAGGVVCIAAIATLIGGPAYVSAHEVLLLVTGQAVWMVLAAASMFRGNTGV